MQDYNIKYTVGPPCVTVPPYPYGNGYCSDGSPMTPIP